MEWSSSQFDVSSGKGEMIYILGFLRFILLINNLIHSTTKANRSELRTPFSQKNNITSPYSRLKPQISFIIGRFIFHISCCCQTLHYL